ncbi:unnamed protein product [Camellia sinensis]
MFCGNHFNKPSRPRPISLAGKSIIYTGPTNRGRLVGSFKVLKRIISEKESKQRKGKQANKQSPNRTVCL